MELKDLGYNATIEKSRVENGLEDFEIGRVTAEHKERYIVRSESGEYEAEITGNLRYTARSREDFPAVGDWVALVSYEPGMAIIHTILPRLSLISRKAVDRTAEKQVIASNIDYAFLVQAIDRDFNINRLERYLAICYTSKVEPVIVLTKTDLAGKERLKEIIDTVKQRIDRVAVYAISNETREGYEALEKFIIRGKTYCFLGSSGAGKSSLINNLSGKSIMQTGSISESTSKGRHITSHRELVVLEQGGILIDNPGMREVGIADSSDGLKTTFDTIITLSKSCKFKDCTHTNELGCAVIEAVEKGEIDRGTYENYLKMEREKAHFDLSLSEKRNKDKKFGKMIKNFKKDIGRISDKHKDE
jgi:ribosome biogenesis GTPase